ncbi:MAG TPA: hypothetical protein VKP14_06490, partial [Gaiellaceae bacterium]|nr:hypothetical protein [Gaiellaceae bacterium]
MPPLDRRVWWNAELVEVVHGEPVDSFLQQAKRARLAGASGPEDEKQHLMKLAEQQLVARMDRSDQTRLDGQRSCRTQSS